MLVLLLSLYAFIPQSIPSNYRFYKLLVTPKSTIISQPDHDLLESLQYLHQYDNEYRHRIKQSKDLNIDISILEFKRAQELKYNKLQEERHKIRLACTIITNSSSEIILGINAKTGSIGINALRNWIDSLNLPRGILNAYNDINQEVPYESMIDKSVYIKYNSSEQGNAYMKIYNGQYYGVIFQPKIVNDDSFHQYGNFPLSLFDR